MSDFIVIDGVRRPARLVTLIDTIKSGDLAKASTLLDTFWADDVADMVSYMGCRLLGQGAYSTVFLVPGEDTAIKMNHNPDDKWPIYAKYAKETGNINPMVPKIHELHTNHENGMVIARIEKLDSARITKSIGMWNVIKALHKDIQSGRLTKRGIRNNTLGYMKNKFDIDAKGHYSPINLAKIVIWLTKHIMDDTNDSYADFHSGNWMLRGKELVLTDPIS